MKLKNYIKGIFSNSLISNGSKVFILNWVNYGFHFVTSILIVRIFGADGKGLYSYYLSFAGIMSVLFSFGLNNSLVYYNKGTKIHFRELVYIVIPPLFIYLLIFLVFTIFHSQIEPTFNLVTSKYILLILPFHSFILYFTLSLKSYFLANKLLRKYQNVVFLSSLIFLTCIFTLYVFRTNFTVESVIILNFVIDLIISLYFFSRIISVSRSQIMFKIFSINKLHHIYNLKSRFLYGFKSYLNVFANIIFQRLDLILLGYFVPLNQIGYYSISILAYQSLLSIPGSIQYLVLGNLLQMKNIGKSKQNLITTNKYYEKISSIVLVVVVIFGIIASYFMIPILYGSEFANSIPSLIILSISAIFLGSSNLSNSLFLTLDKATLPGIAMLIAGLFKIILLYILIPLFSIEGAAISNLIMSILIFLFRRNYIKTLQTKL